jgi:outer membrane protein assembly factor BamB
LTVTDGSGVVASTPITASATLSPGNHWVTLMGRRDGIAVQKLLTVHTGWLERGYSAFGRSFNPLENVLNPSNVGGLQEDWTLSSGSTTFDGPVVGIGARQVFFGDGNGVVRAVNEVTGAPVWSRALPGPIESTPAVDSGRVYVHDNDGNLYALNGSTGAVIWKGMTASNYSTPAVSGGRVFTVALPGTVFSFAVGCGTGGVTCSPLWTRPLGGGSESSPAVSNGVVYVGSDDGALNALNAAHGYVLWKGILPTSVDTNSPAVANGVVYISTFSPGVLTAFPAACGNGGGLCAPLWQTDTFGNADGAPAVANGVVYAGFATGVDNGTIVALPAGSFCGTPCAPLWTATPAGDIESPLIVSDGELIADVTDGAVGGVTAWDLPAGLRVPVVRPDPRTLRPDLALKPIR